MSVVTKSVERRAERITWVKAGPDLASCQRCGKKATAPALPMPTDAFLLWMYSAILAHEFCEERKA